MRSATTSTDRSETVATKFLKNYEVLLSWSSWELFLIYSWSLGSSITKIIIRVVIIVACGQKAVIWAEQTVERVEAQGSAFFLVCSTRVVGSYTSVDAAASL